MGEKVEERAKNTAQMKRKMAWVPNRG